MNASNKKEIRVIVEITKTERRDLEFHHDHTTGREIKEKAGVPLHEELFAFRDGKFHPVGNDEKISIKNDEHFFVVPKGAIHYSVDDEPQWTKDRELTPVKIMEYAGIDPKKNYLVEIKHDHNKESFKDDPDKIIPMHNGMKFITHFTGPKPVSGT